MGYAAGIPIGFMGGMTCSHCMINGSPQPWVKEVGCVTWIIPDLGDQPVYIKDCGLFLPDLAIIPDIKLAGLWD